MAAPPDDRTLSSIADAEEDQKETDKLRKALFEDYTMFLFNNILMTVQFFENYEREMSNLRDTCTDEYSLDSDNFKTFDADTLHKLISTRVTYQRRVTTKKSEPEFIHPVRTYVTYQNVEIANNTASAGGKRVLYNPYYSLIAQRCEDDRKEASGYVNVMRFAEKRSETVVGTALIHHPDNDDTGEPKRKPIQSGVLLSKSDTFYILESEKRTKPYPLSSYRTYERITQSTEIPRSCFKEHEKQSVRNMRRAGVNRGKSMSGKVSQVILLSAAFKRHFSEVFATHLAGQLGLNKLGTAMFHLDHVVARKERETHHVIPVLEMTEWPHAFKIELTSERKGNGIEWPTKAMQRAIQKLGCSLVPMGYHETSEETADYTLEWKIEFPKAEKYLMTHTMHTHVRCYLFALILHKTFIGTDETAPLFGPTHIANLLFLMIRKNFLAWPEYSQGETLARYLRIMEGTLQKKRLKSFFLRNRNLYANTPARVLHKAQTIIARILENPIPYVLKALTNLKFRDDFYPEFDYMRLYNVLTVTDLNEYLNPKPPVKVKGRKKQPEPKVIARETIDEEELMEEKNTPLHREEVLRLFIDHFIKVANRSREYKSYDHAMLYLTQARRLTTILSEESKTLGEIQDFSKRIQNGIQLCNRETFTGGDGRIRTVTDVASPARKKQMLDVYVTRL